MFTKYDEYELLELFENEPIIISSKEAGMFIYTKQSSNRIKIVLSFSIYEKECCISLNFEEHLIFESFLKNVEYLRSENGYCLRIHQNEGTSDYLIYFKPNILIKIEKTFEVK